MFSYVCWAAPTNVPINQLFGVGWGWVFWLAVHWWVSSLSRTLWIFSHVPDICQPNQVSQLTCPHNQVFYTASAVWWVLVLICYTNLSFYWLPFPGVCLIGPARQFGTGSVYHPHLYTIIVGVFIPVPFYLWQRCYPDSWAHYVSTPVVIAGLSAIPPATGINYSSWFLVAFIFQYLIRKKNFAWWSKFNYVLSSALDSGAAISIIVIFFALQVGCLFLLFSDGSWMIFIYMLVPERWDPTELVG